jgi:hypothetical protein
MLAHAAARVLVAAGELTLAEEGMPVAVVEILEAALKRVEAPEGPGRHPRQAQPSIVLEGGDKGRALEDTKLHVVTRDSLQPREVKGLLERLGLLDVVLDRRVQRAHQLDHQGLQAMCPFGQVEDTHSQSSQKSVHTASTGMEASWARNSAMRARECFCSSGETRHSLKCRRSRS